MRLHSFTDYLVYIVDYCVNFFMVLDEGFES